MPVDIINALTKLLHELGPWAGVAVVAVSGYWSWRAKEHSKANAAKIDVIDTKTEQVAAKVAENTTKTEEVAAQVAEVQQAVNGRVDQLAEAAKREGYQQAKAEIEQHIGGSG